MSSWVNLWASRLALSDNHVQRATFEQLKGSINLVLLWSGDSRLLTTYAAVLDPHAARAAEATRFVTWLEDGEGGVGLARIGSIGARCNRFEYGLRPLPGRCHPRCRGDSAAAVVGWR